MKAVTINKLNHPKHPPHMSPQNLTALVSLNLQSIRLVTFTSLIRLLRCQNTTICSHLKGPVTVLPSSQNTAPHPKWITHSRITPNLRVCLQLEALTAAQSSLPIKHLLLRISKNLKGRTTNFSKSIVNVRMSRMTNDRTPDRTQLERLRIPGKLKTLMSTM